MADINGATACMTPIMRPYLIILCDLDSKRPPPDHHRPLPASSDCSADGWLRRTGASDYGLFFRSARDDTDRTCYTQFCINLLLTLLGESALVFRSASSSAYIVIDQASFLG